VWCHPPPTCYGLAAFHLPETPEKVVLEMDVKLYVGNLSRSTTEDEIKTLFSQAGAVSAVEVIKDRDSGESRGFAFVTMNDQAEANKAITMFNAYSMGDRQLKVNVAKPRTDRA